MKYLVIHVGRNYYGIIETTRRTTVRTNQINALIRRLSKIEAKRKKKNYKASL